MVAVVDLVGERESARLEEHAFGFNEVRNVTSLRWLVRHLLGNAGGMFSIEKFHAALKSQGIPIAKDTLHQFLRYLEDCFLVRIVWMESASERQRMVNPRKVYPVDPGLIPVFDRTGRANPGHALETAVLLELERRGHEVTYVRTPKGYLEKPPDSLGPLSGRAAYAHDSTHAGPPPTTGGVVTGGPEGMRPGRVTPEQSARRCDTSSQAEQVPLG